MLPDPDVTHLGMTVAVFEVEIGVFQFHQLRASFSSLCFYFYAFALRFFPPPAAADATSLLLLLLMMALSERKSRAPPPRSPTVTATAA